MAEPKDFSNLAPEVAAVVDTVLRLCLREVAGPGLSDEEMVAVGWELLQDGMIELIERDEDVGIRLACTPEEMQAYISGPH